MALETVPKDLRHLRACLLCSLVKVSAGALVVGAIGEAEWEKEGETGPDTGKERSEIQGVGSLREPLLMSVELDVSWVSVPAEGCVAVLRLT